MKIIDILILSGPFISNKYKLDNNSGVVIMMLNVIILFENKSVFNKKRKTIYTGYTLKNLI